MDKTIKEIPVYGRSLQEVRSAVKKWIATYKIKIEEEGPDFIKGRIGRPVSIFPSIAPRYFNIFFKSTYKCIIVYTEGYTMYGVCTVGFSEKCFLGCIPRNQGWIIINKLWDKLRLMSIRTDNYCWICNKIIKTNKGKTCPDCGHKVTTIK